MKNKASKRNSDLEVESIIQAVGAQMGEQISKASAYRMIQIRELPSFSISRTVGVRWEDLDAFIESHMIR